MFVQFEQLSYNICYVMIKDTTQKKISYLLCSPMWLKFAVLLGGCGVHPYQAA